MNIEAEKAPTETVRHITGSLFAFDESLVQTKLHPAVGYRLALDLPDGGPAVLTLSHFDSTPDAAVLLPADVARQLDHVLFHAEHMTERRVREKRALGYIPCTICDEGRLFRDCPVCDEDRLATSSAISAYRYPWLTLSDVEPHLDALPVDWHATAEAIPEWSRSALREHHPELIGTVHEISVRCVNVDLPGLSSDDAAAIYLRQGELGGVAWWTVVGEYYDFGRDHDDAVDVLQALADAAVSVRYGVAAMADPTLLTAHRGPWLTVEAVTEFLQLVPTEWCPVVQGWPEYTDNRIAEFSGKTEEGRLNCVTLDLPGLGAMDHEGAYPGLCLHFSKARNVVELSWSAYLAGPKGYKRSVGRGDTPDVREAVQAGVKALQCRLQDDAVVPS